MATVLYKKNKNGSIQQWRIWVVEDVVYTKYGKLNGKMQTSSKVVIPKNIGKTNETTPNEQAKSEASSTVQKQKDKGYYSTIEEAETNVVFLPMLAYELKQKAKEKLKFPLYVQPKLDGVRCLAHWVEDKVKLTSRGGKEYHIPHLAKELERVLPEGVVLDGEIYIHGLIRQDINALVKKYRMDEYDNSGYSSLDLEYWVYDTFTLESLRSPFKERFSRLERFFEKNVGLQKVRKTSTIEALKVVHLEAFHKTFVRRNFEGTILRFYDGTYELGHRSRSLLKYKDFKDEEFEIVGFVDGVGRFSGCVVWSCKATNGRLFNVVPKGTLEQKREWFETGDSYIGKKITVKYQSLSKDGIPEFPVGLGFRLTGDK